MIDQHFINHYNKNNSDVNLIIDVMCHPKKEDARMFLCMINDVMNYYISRIDDEVRYPLLYIPASEVWAQEICIEFVTLKLSLLYNRLIQIKLRADIERACMTLPMDCSAKSKKFKQAQNNYKYSKRIYNYIKNRNIPESSINKNLIICKPFDCSVRENPYLDNYCGNEKTICDKRYAVSRADIEVGALDRPIKKNKGLCKIENMFVFLSRSANGRFSEAYSFQKPRIERLNKLGTGIQNVFYFYFSTKPYKLQRQLTWKLKNAADILHENVKEMKDFISISAEESDFIFGRIRKQNKLIIQQEGLDDFKTLVDDALDACEYNIQARNNLAVCFNEYSQNLFKNEFENSIDDIDAQYFDIFFKNIQYTWENKIFPEIMTFLNGQTKVCLILDYFMPDYYKQHIVSVFDSYGIGVITQTFKSLKYKALEGKYVSNNPSNKIIVLSYQGHYVGRPYNHYPNSFDPICLCEKQELLNIINPFVFDPYYAVHHYEYMRTLRNILSSDYRMNYVKCTVPLPERPKRKIDDSRDRSTSRSSNSHRANQNNKRYSAFTGSSKSIKLIESDYVICKENNLFSNEQIIPVSSLNSLMQESEQAFLICPLSKLQDILESILEQSEDEIKKDELYIRQDERYALTDDEVSSESELWEILLRRKVELRGADIVFAEVMEKIPYSEQIKRQSFERWYAQNNDMILPRSRRMQDALFQYLSIATPYDKIIRRKKAQKGTKTEQKNSMLRSFLCNNLFSDDYKQAFERLSDGMKDMFGIDNHDDLEALIDLLKKEIDYTEIKNISIYDKN